MAYYKLEFKTFAIGYVLILLSNLNLSAQYQDWKKLSRLPICRTGHAEVAQDGKIYFTHEDSRPEIYESSDLGETWQMKELPDVNVSWSMIYFSDGEPILKGTDDAYIKRNGTWKPLDTNRRTYCISLYNDTIFRVQDKILEYSVDKGSSFEEISEIQIWGTLNHEEIFLSDNYVYLSGSRSFSVLDRKGNIIVEDRSLPALNGIIQNDYPYIITQDDKILYSARDSILYSEDFMETWTSTSWNDFITEGEIILEYDLYEGQIYGLTRRQGVYKMKDFSDPFNWEPVYADTTRYNSSISNIDSNLFMLTDDFSCRIINKQNGELVKIIDPGNFATSVRLEQIESSDKAIYALSYGGLHYSLDYGSSWKELYPTGESVLVRGNSIAVDNRGYLYYFNNNRLLRTIDNGITNEDITPENYTSDRVWYGHLRFTPNDELLLIDNDFSSRRVYNSSDYGDNWEDVEITQSIFDPIIYGDLIISSNSIFSATERTSGFTRTFNLRDIGMEVYNTTSIMDNGVVFISGRPSNWADISLLYKSSDLGRSFNPAIINGIPEDYAYRNLYVTSRNDIISISNPYVYSSTFISNKSIYLCDDPSSEELEFEKIDLNDLIEGNWLLEFYKTKSGFGYIIDNDFRIYRSESNLDYPTRIYGSIVIDENENCISEESDHLSGWIVTATDLQENKWYSYSDNGGYSIDLPSGEYVLEANPTNDFWEICEAQSFRIDLSQEMQIDIPAIKKEECAEIVSDISIPMQRRCFENRAFLNIKNQGPSVAYKCDLTIQLDPFYESVVFSDNVTSLGDNKYLLKTGDLEVGDSKSIQIDYILSCLASLGQIHCNSVYATSENMCSDPDSTSFSSEYQQNIGSYDPNDIRAFNLAGFEDDLFKKDETISYQIRFQNTGTDTAFNVNIINELPPNLDFSSFKLIGSSHKVSIDINKSLLDFNLDNIFLPDSTTNSLSSQGFIEYTIRPSKDISYGEDISNDAKIYFDFNSPIATNVSQITIESLSSVIDKTPIINWNIYPNPSDGIIHISGINNDIDIKAEIFTMEGKKISMKTIYRDSLIDYSKLPKGLYLIKLTSKAELLGVKKLIITS